MKPKHQRLFLICSALMGLGIAGSLVLVAFQDTLVFFYTPSDLLQKNISPQQRIRVGGLVDMDSPQQRGENVHFKITDQKETIMVSYHGILPDLFREGQGVVAEGYLMNPTHFQAESVLAKHDENYMPREVAEGLREQCK
ncbi:MAG: cytochrome c maturation protein CcmE [Alphaproteobacteria bacterium]|nr:cytochrome c maturation protein CcmE [Alphaproteobacteria bacterium]